MFICFQASACSFLYVIVDDFLLSYSFFGGFFHLTYIRTYSDRKYAVVLSGKKDWEKSSHRNDYEFDDGELWHFFLIIWTLRGNIFIGVISSHLTESKNRSDVILMKNWSCRCEFLGNR